MHEHNDLLFRKFTDQAFIEIALIRWVVHRLAIRQKDGDPRIDKIEKDFLDYCKSENIGVNSAHFDSGILFTLSKPILVSGVEAISRSSKSDEIKGIITDELKSYDQLLKRLSIDVGKITQLEKDKSATWTLLRHIRNSLGHYRHRINGNGELRVDFEDYYNEGKTADFSMPLFSVLQLSVDVGTASIMARKNLFPEWGTKFSIS
jgi:hypothetical protein